MKEEWGEIEGREGGREREREKERERESETEGEGGKESHVIQKLFDIKVAQFKIHLLSCWNQSGHFKLLSKSSTNQSIASLTENV